MGEYDTKLRKANESILILAQADQYKFCPFRTTFLTSNKKSTQVLKTHSPFDTKFTFTVIWLLVRSIQKLIFQIKYVLEDILLRKLDLE